MHGFSKDRWRQAAWARFQKASRPGAKRCCPDPNAQWYQDMLTIEHLQKIVDWCESRHLNVVFEKRFAGVYVMETQTIHLTTHVRPEKQLHYLLHEVGHFLIGMKPDHERFGNGYPQGENPKHIKSDVHKIACLEEEFEAWHRGWKLAKRLRLSLDRASFDRTRIECLKSYVGWTHRRGK